MASGDTKTEQMLDILGNGGDASNFRGCCNTKAQAYILDAIDRVQAVEDEVERLENNPDVVDIVATYQDLENYDKTTLTDKDIIRVLEDSTHDNNSTYYRYNASTNDFDFVGEISGGGSSVSVVQTPGDSTTSVMSQNATTSMVYDDPSTRGRVKIGTSASTSGNSTVAIGSSASATGQYGVAVGSTTSAAGRSVALGNAARSGVGYQVVLGSNATATSSGSFGAVALGAYSSPTRRGEVNVGTSETTYGFNQTNYRLISGVHDGAADHDAVTVGQINTVIDAINAALSTNIAHIGSQ